jgi:hypothetical protein
LLRRTKAQNPFPIFNFSFSDDWNNLSTQNIRVHEYQKEKIKKISKFPGRMKLHDPGGG